MVQNIDFSAVLLVVLQVVGALIATYVLVKLPALTRLGLEWLKSATLISKSHQVNAIKNRLIDLVGQKVLMVEQTVIEELKERAADGQLTKSELLEALLEAKERVIEDVRRDASAQGLWAALVFVVFGGEGNSALNWLDDVVEATVAKLPPSGLQTPTLAGDPPAMSYPSAARKATMAVVETGTPVPVVVPVPAVP